MSEGIPTITIEIGNLENDVYPLRLFHHTETGLIEKAATEIKKEEFDVSRWEFDPIEKFLNEPDASDDFEEIGTKLYGLISQGEVGKVWKEILPETLDSCRVLLNIKAEEIAAFPWELTYSDDVDWLTVDEARTFTRWFDLPKVISSPEIPSILRVLIIIGVDKNDSEIKPLAEIRKIESVIHKQNRTAIENKLFHRIVDIEILWQPELEDIAKKGGEFKPHILHFIGHGGFDSRNKPFLELTSQKTGKIEWFHNMIKNIIKNFGTIPRFVFINACRSQNKTLSETELKRQAWSIGDIFRRLGVPAVLTMQADIDGEVAGVFSGAIYESLANLKTLDSALGYARNAIMWKTTTSKTRDWATPVLTLSAPPEEILPFKPKVSEELLKEIKNCEAFSEIERFVNRVEPRRQLIQKFYPPPPEMPDKFLTVVSGDHDSGKSWLVKWCLEVCSLLSNDVRYVEVGGTGSKTWLDVLLQIRKGYDSPRSTQLIYRELDPKHFADFYWSLDHLSRELPVPARDNSPVVPNDDYKLAGTKWFTDFADKIIESFLSSLGQIATPENPLIIVLDHFRGILEDDMKTILIPKLLQPIARGEFKSVKFILVLTGDEYRDFDIKNLLGGLNEVSVQLFERKAFFEFFCDYVRKSKQLKGQDYVEETIQGLAEFVEKMAKELPGGFPCSQVTMLDNII